MVWGLGEEAQTASVDAHLQGMNPASDEFTRLPTLKSLLGATFTVKNNFYVRGHTTIDWRSVWLSPPCRYWLVCEFNQWVAVLEFAFLSYNFDVLVR